MVELLEAYRFLVYAVVLRAVSAGITLGGAVLVLVGYPPEAPIEFAFLFIGGVLVLGGAGGVLFPSRTWGLTSDTGPE
jgi:hypothetical protein